MKKSNFTEDRNAVLGFKLKPLKKDFAPDATAKPIFRAYVQTKGTLTQEGLMAEIAERTGFDVGLVQYIDGVRDSVMSDAVRSGKNLLLNSMATRITVRGAFECVDSPMTPGRNAVANTIFMRGALKAAIGSVTAKNTVKGASPEIVIVTDKTADIECQVMVGHVIYIAGRDIYINPEQTDEGVFILNPGTDEVVATAEVTESDQFLIKCAFATVPTAGTYDLVVKSRAGLGASYRLAEASKPVKVVT